MSRTRARDKSFSHPEGKKARKVQNRAQMARTVAAQIRHEIEGEDGPIIALSAKHESFANRAISAICQQFPGKKDLAKSVKGEAMGMTFTA